jgi:hypothetical protein
LLHLARLGAGFGPPVLVAFSIDRDITCSIMPNKSLTYCSRGEEEDKGTAELERGRLIVPACITSSKRLIYEVADEKEAIQPTCSIGQPMIDQTRTNSSHPGVRGQATHGLCTSVISITNERHVQKPRGKSPVTTAKKKGQQVQS